MALVFIFIVGLIVGSFLNAVIWRMDKEESVFKGRSVCPACKHKLSFEDLIPLLSFVLLRGRCRYCKASISWQYPLVELGTALVFAFLFWWVGLNIAHLLLLWFISAALIIIFVYDLKHFLIPDVVVYPAIVVSALWQLLQGQLVGPLSAGIGAAFFFLCLYLVSKGTWMGFGDVKLALLMGFILGWPNILVALFFAFLVGAILGLVLVALDKKGMRSEVPFGPFLVAGTAFAFVWGEMIVDWYCNLLMI